MPNVRVGLIGSQFISTIHAEGLRSCAEAEIVAVASAHAERARTFAERFHIPQHFDDYRRLLDRSDIDLVVIGTPNDLHCEMTVAAAQRGKHVVVEKPL